MLRRSLDIAAKRSTLAYCKNRNLAVCPMSGHFSNWVIIIHGHETLATILCISGTGSAAPIDMKSGVIISFTTQCDCIETGYVSCWDGKAWNGTECIGTMEKVRRRRGIMCDESEYGLDVGKGRTQMSVHWAKEREIMLGVEMVRVSGNNSRKGHTVPQDMCSVNIIIAILFVCFATKRCYW
jgi:hypothetical protein